MLADRHATRVQGYSDIATDNLLRRQGTCLDTPIRTLVWAVGDGSFTAVCLPNIGKSNRDCPAVWYAAADLRNAGWRTGIASVLCPVEDASDC